MISCSEYGHNFDDNLIALVKKNPMLYKLKYSMNQKHLVYLRQSVWEEIGAKLNHTAGMCKKMIIAC